MNEPVRKPLPAVHRLAPGAFYGWTIAFGLAALSSVVVGIGFCGIAVFLDALATERAAHAAYRQAGLGPQDVDVVELHDCFTIAEIVATEGLGLCEPGTGGLAAEKGETSLGGRIPVNVSGGLKAKGHPIGATGAAQIAEIATQLRGEAGRRQVEGATVGLTHTLGGNTATVLVSLFGRD